MNTRTAVPFALLGILGGIALLRKSPEWYWWLIVWAFSVLIALVAELGQLILPLRHFDWGDVCWGALGAGSGMVLV
ncbi:VanZ family protein [Spirosoma fluminis]